MYTTPAKTYRDIIEESNLSHSSRTTDETQLMILDWMMKEQKKYPKGSKVIYDRCPWDNLAYTLLGNAMGNISDEVAAATISFVKESMKELDIIFWIRKNPNIKIIIDGLRDANEEYIDKTEEIFSGLYDDYTNDLDSDVFYPKDDCPAIIPIENDFLSVDDRLMFIGEFLDYKGDLLTTDQSILDPANLATMEQMLKEQSHQLQTEKEIKKIINNFKSQ